MVRGPAALLGLVGVTLAYVLLAPELPQLHPHELSAIVAFSSGRTLIVGIVAGLVAIANTPENFAREIMDLFNCALGN